jgi:hypothetical protein
MLLGTHHDSLGVDWHCGRLACLLVTLALAHFRSVLLGTHHDHLGVDWRRGRVACLLVALALAHLPGVRRGRRRRHGAIAADYRGICGVGRRTREGRSGDQRDEGWINEIKKTIVAKI